MKLISTLAAAAALCAAIPAVAAPVTLDFEDQASFASLVYPANANGIAANAALVGLANDGSGNGLPDGQFFSNNPSGSLVMYVFGPLPGERAEITSTVGFGGSATFAYSASGSGSVYARDGSGAILDQFDFLANSNGTDSTSPFATWSLGTLTFGDVAYSIDFTDAAGLALFDDVKVNTVPLPAAAWLLLSGLGGLGTILRRRRLA